MSPTPVGKFFYGSADVHIGHQKSATSEPVGTLANWRRQVADVDVVKNTIAGGGVCGGHKRTAVNSDVKTRSFFKRPPAAVNSTTYHCPGPGYRYHAPHTHPPRNAQKCVYGYNPGAKQTSIL